MYYISSDCILSADGRGMLKPNLKKHQFLAKNLAMKIQHVAGFRLVRRSVVQNIHDSSTFLLEISINRQEC